MNPKNQAKKFSLLTHRDISCDQVITQMVIQCLHARTYEGYNYLYMQNVWNELLIQVQEGYSKFGLETFASLNPFVTGIEEAVYKLRNLKFW